MSSQSQKLFLGIWVFNCLYCLLPIQALGQSITKSEIFNQANTSVQDWTIINSDQLETEFSRNSYAVNLPAGANWNAKISIPDRLKSSFKSEESTLEFSARVVSSNNQETTGYGLIFDDFGEEYNLLYIGQEGGRIFSTIIPRREKTNGFTKPLKEGRGIAYNEGETYKTTIRRVGPNYSVYINGVLTMRFVHEAIVQFERLYVTTGKYEFSNIKAFSEFVFADGAEIPTLTPKEWDPAKAKIHLIMAAIGDYKNGILDLLNSPATDVDSLKAFWRSPSGGNVPASNIVALQNGTATTDNILNAILDATKESGKDDLIIIYLSGHGNSSFFYSMDDHVSYKRIVEILKYSHAKSNLVILDACRSGSIKNLILSPTKSSPDSDDLAALFKYRMAMADAGSIYLTSCADNEFSFDGRSSKDNSAFTSAILTILRDPQAFTNNVLTVASLYSKLNLFFTRWNSNNKGKYVSKTVLREGAYVTERHPIQMTPQLISSKANSYNLPFAVKK